MSVGSESVGSKSVLRFCDRSRWWTPIGSTGRHAAPTVEAAKGHWFLIECSEKREESMIKTQWMIVVLVVSLCAATAEARGRRYVQQQGYTQYYNTPAPQYYNTVAPVQTVATPTNVVVPSNNSVVTTNGVIQTSGVETSKSGIVQANGVVTTSTGTVPVVAAAAPGSAQWKAEQSARIGSVQHLGGGFGGGSFEGNGFGATADQAIRNSCFWGQRTPIEIGVARGANGYYATIFYR
jgi:hypothetical protein